MRGGENRPFYADRTLGVVPANPCISGDIGQVIARVVDGWPLDRFKRRFSRTIVTGFAGIGGMGCAVTAVATAPLPKIALPVESCDPRAGWRRRGAVDHEGDQDEARPGCRAPDGRERSLGLY
ncbi:MAG: carboxyl transferase domain-containing protein [Pseudomonadota bacterium]